MTLTEAVGTSLGSLTVGGWLSGALIRSAGSIGPVTAGGLVYSRILVSFDPQTLDGETFDEQSDFLETAGSLKSLIVRGTPGAEMPFIGSTIAAHRIDRIKLREINTEMAPGVEFGVVASSIGSLELPGADGLVKLSNLETGLVISEDDFRVRLV